MHWLYVHFGISGTGSWYGFWSGAGSDLGELAIVGGLISIYHRHNCHVKGCWRVGKHVVDGTPYTTCRHHHPELKGRPKVTANDVFVAHYDHKHR